MKVHVYRSPPERTEYLELATIDIEYLSGFHVANIAGGAAREVGHRLKRPMLAAYMSCEAPYEGWLGHSGAHGDCPHRIKVLIPKVHNEREIVRHVEAQIKKGC